MDSSNYVIIMAGGIGSRFWPTSRENMPKQFLDIMNLGKSLLAITYERFQSICPSENILIVTNENYRSIIKEQIEGITDEQILGEPMGRNTAPCIAYAAYRIRKKNPDARMIVAPSDHVIFQEEEFLRIIQKALDRVQKEDHIITIGIKPHKPETGYGYIQYHESKDRDDPEIKPVKTFTEKPELELAKTFLDSGDFVWNAGIFVWNLRTIIKCFEIYLAEIAETFAELDPYYNTQEEASRIAVAYSHTKPISIDYGVMEKAQNVFVIPADFGWSDVGSWSALHEISDKDSNENLIDANTLLFNVKNSIVKGPQDHLIVAEGLKGYLVVHHENATLICKKDNERKFRKIYSEVKKQKGSEFL